MAFHLGFPMFPIDVPIAFVISGGGFFVAAGMTLLALSSERHVRGEPCVKYLPKLLEKRSANSR